MEEIDIYSRALFELFEYVQAYALLVCKQHGCIVPPQHLGTHLGHQHSFSSDTCRKIYAALQSNFLDRNIPLLWSEEELSNLRFPTGGVPQIPYLPVYYNGLLCQIAGPDQKQCGYICRDLSGMQGHCRKNHQWVNPRRRGRAPESQRLIPPSVPWLTGVSCQQLGKTRSAQRYFEVIPHGNKSSPTVQATEGRTTGDRLGVRDGDAGGEDVWDQVERRLAKAEQDAQAESAPTAEEFGASPLGTYPLCLSPWLEVTRWHRYLDGQRLADVAKLAVLPASDSAQIFSGDAPLLVLLRSFDRLIDESRKSVLSDEKINVFDQHRVNSFVRGRPHPRPLLVQLQDGTYKRYTTVWKQLLSFIYHVVVRRDGPQLHYVITDAQSTALEKLLSTIQEALNGAESGQDAVTPSTRGESEERGPLRGRLSDLCLEFCISLLDHSLRGNIYDSLIVGFLAVLGIDVGSGGFHEPVAYTPKLSAVAKIAQILVLQKAVRAAELGIVDFPADMIDEMQDRFMVYGSRSPMNWVQKLRSYGRKVRDNTTSLGYIIWSDDGEHLSYKGFELDMGQLRWFVRDQVEAAQDMLHDLLLLGPDKDDRAELLPPLSMRDLKDDPTVKTAGWSFLLDRRNSGQLAGHDRWLLNRVRGDRRLRMQFLCGSGLSVWDRQATERYLQKVREFLERLLLLVHITSGQPARGTELLTLQWRNTNHGLRRNIFVENGLVTFVTSYHKGYSISGSTKIIHRYLPPEVSELMVYYPWLIVPFCKQIALLASDDPASQFPSTLLWSRVSGECRKELKEEPWPTKRLRDVLAREFKQHLATDANVVIWRHVAIAISRRHLNGKGFKRDYDGQEDLQSIADKQAAHNSAWAGQIYARGIEEAPGHVASVRAEYRDISRRWHKCLGFGVLLEPRRPLQERRMVNEQNLFSGRRVLHQESRGEEKENGSPLESQGTSLLPVKRKRADEQSALDEWFRLGLMFKKRRVRTARKA